MSDFCLDCQREVDRCWMTRAMRSCGGHCMDCGGYNFETDEQKEERETNEMLEKALRIGEQHE